MSPSASRHLTLACSRCGRAAAEFALLPASSDPQAEWDQQRDRLERTEFMGACTKFGSRAELEALFEQLRRADFPAAREIDWDFVGFHCRECDRVYCQNCWQIDPPTFDEGFYDYTSATCPQGHAQVVDD